MTSIRFLDHDGFLGQRAQYVDPEKLAKVAEELRLIAIDPASSSTGCALCDLGHEPRKIVQLKSRMYRPIPYSKHRSKRIWKKLKKRQQLDMTKGPFIVQLDGEVMELRIREALNGKVKGLVLK